jgi:multiple sugar transport system substrate-binding protein
MRSRFFILATLLILAPFGARAADLVVWWEKGFYPQEDEAVAEIIAAFEQKTGKDVELAFYPQADIPTQIDEALAAGRPPDFAFGFLLWSYAPKWALEDRLLDLSTAVGGFSNLFDPNQLDHAMLLNGKTGQRALYGLPIGQVPNYLHVWKSVVERAGFSLDDIPEEWSAFWSFWCDQVQPAVREATRRDDIWGVGLAMSPESADTTDQFIQFVHAFDANYVTRDGRLIIDDPAIRRQLVEAIDGYTAIYRKNCTPPDAITWANIDNNKRFLAQSVVMTPNISLSIPNALKSERADDYYKNIATIEWPLGRSGAPIPIEAGLLKAVALKDGGKSTAAQEFVRFLVSEGWLAHYLNFSGERILPSMPRLLQQPFWLDPSDPHRMAAAMQAETMPLAHDYAAASGDLRHNRIYQERIWAKAINRITADGISPEQAVDEAIARIKEILEE